MAYVNHEHDLIDSVEMYLRTVLELEEEGAVPLRARIAERLGLSVPTVSQTVARMQRDGLLVVSGDRHIELTPEGRAAAVRVMRKHRLAECLLVDVIGLEWPLVHDEACRWEHVMSEKVERRLLELLGHPTQSPYGNPIPGLAELGELTDVAPGPGAVAGRELVALADVAGTPGTAGRVVVRRFGEPIQSDTALLTRLRRVGVRPDAEVPVSWVNGRVRIGPGAGAWDDGADPGGGAEPGAAGAEPDGEGVELDLAAAAHLFVTAAD
jgi:DtxR family transcriptional regulator, Mn-dependent transcriptional regulator